MKILGIIPARGGSKGVPGKNIKLLGGNPLLSYTSKSAFDAKLLSKIIVSTDCENIANVAKQNNIDVPFLRPNELATDFSSSIEVVQHAIEYFEKQGEFYDAVCLLQPTSPFRAKGFIDLAIQKFINDEADALVSVLPVPHEFNPHWVFEPNVDGYLSLATGETEIIKRRQDLPKSYFRDGSIYLTKTSFIKKGTFYGEKLSFIENESKFYVNIDTMYDWDKAENLLPELKSLL